MKKIIASFVAGSMLAAGGLVAASLTTTDVAVAQETETVTATETVRHRHFGGEMLEVAAGLLGMTADDLRSALADGSTIADVAAAENVELQTVIDGLVADATTRIQERAAAKIAELPDRVTELVNGDFRPRPRAGHLADVAELLGLEVADLLTELGEGATIADVAAAEGVEREQLIDDLVAAATSRIDEGVAEGRIDETRAAEMKANVEQRVTDLVDGTFDPGARPGGRRGHHGPGGGPGAGAGFGPGGAPAGGSSV